MTAIEIKHEIGKALDQVPEKLLGDILDFIRQVQSDETSNPSLPSHLTKILSEDSELLQKLAE